MFKQKFIQPMRQIIYLIDSASQPDDLASI